MLWEYKLRTSTTNSTARSFYWAFDGWSECSATCGGGQQVHYSRKFPDFGLYGTALF